MTAAARPVSNSLCPWILLPTRLVLFGLFQALFALGYALSGSSDAWERSAAWWPLTVTLTNLVSIGILIRLYRQEGRRYWNIFRFDRRHIKSDLLVLFGMLVISGPVAMLPNTLLATALYADATIPLRQFLAPLPALGIFTAVVLFPITQGLAELAFYFLYIMPRLEQQVRPWLAYGLASLFLGLQHMTVPLRLEGPFLLWRAVMYIPFAFLVGALLKWRPRMLPYMAIVHVLIDFATGIMYLMPM